MGVTFVSAFHTSTNLIISGGNNILDVLSGGTAVYTVVEAQGQSLISAGGIFSSSLIEGSFSYDGLQGGTGYYTTATNGADEDIDSGSKAYYTLLSNGGYQAINDGTAYGTVVRGGAQYVYGGAASDTVIVGGSQIVGGGLAYGTVITNGGIQYADAGGDVTSTVVQDGGTQEVSGGYVDSTSVELGGLEELYAVASDTRVAIGGSAVVFNGGEAAAMRIDFGGVAEIAGSSSETIVYGGGMMFVLNGGEAFGGVIDDTGQMIVSNGGVAAAVEVGYSGVQIVESGGETTGGTVDSGGVLVVSADAMAYGTQVLSGGIEVVAGGAVVDADVQFAHGATGELSLADPASFAGTVEDFGGGDRVDLTDLVFSGTTSATLSGDTLYVTEGAVTDTITVDPAGLDSADFKLAADSGTGTDVTVTCFCAGTAIATPHGETPVERLRAGDLVRLADGPALPVRWVGCQTVSRQFADPVRVLPIRIRAGALGEGLPKRDLLVSPGHAVLLDGLLVHAGALVNGSGIVREHHVPEVFRYYHVELDRHALLLAEGVAAESFVDGHEPVRFDNAAERVAVADAVELPYPRIKARRQVPAALRVAA